MKQNMDTLMEGGSGTDTFSKNMPSFLPERYEAGTLNTPAIVSLCAGIDYIEKIGIENIQKHLGALTLRITDILSSTPYVNVHGAENGIVSFNIGTLNSSLVSEHLNKYGIATRSGYHCAPLVHKKMGTEKSGAVRISLSYLNSINECDQLYHALKALI
jgi:selenocysteine lyase/cysteine desulfurase